MNQQMNISSISNPEFINLQPLDINPLMSSCEIKVLYLGKNRNRTYIDKETATSMAKTLRGAPIVGYYREDKDDFRDHGDQIVFDDEGIHFNCLTKPYGFVSPDAKVWFQKFEEEDPFGNTVEREYLMTTGYLWTGQFEECKVAIEEGRPQSMELADDESLKGSWAEDSKSGLEFFIINDAMFSKLCILGQDIEPCFEGAAVTAPDVSKNFTLDSDFTKTLYSMMQELQFALRGGTSMKDDKKIVDQQTADDNAGEVAKNFSANQDKVGETHMNENKDSLEGADNANSSSSFVKKEDVDDKKAKEPDKEDKDKKYTALEEQYSDLQKKYEAMEQTYQELKAFKNEVENTKKDEMIAKFFMLSDEDKKDVIENKDKYTVEEIQSKLSVIYTNKQFELAQQKALTSAAKNNANVVTYTAADSGAPALPDWVKAVRETEQQMNV